MQRRDFLRCSAMAGGLAGLAPALAWTQPARATPPAAPTADWAWLTGQWKVGHRRLRERLAGSHDWETFDGASAVWPTLGGWGNLDDNLVDLPAGAYRGVSLRAYDPVSARWAIWWLDGRDPARIDPPVHGRFDGDSGIFTGRDTLRGQPIVMRFAWRDIHGPRPWWEQSFSGDDGRTWEVNWQNWFTRIADAASPLPLLRDAPHDWDFLLGRWRLRGQQKRDRLAGASGWEPFDGTLAHWPLLGGHGNVADLALRTPHGEEHRLWMHTHDTAAGEWLAWRLDRREPTRIAPPARGSFAGDSITFTESGSVPAATRMTWTRTGPASVRAEQAVSTDGGAHWSPWWRAELARAD